MGKRNRSIGIKNPEQKSSFYLLKIEEIKKKIQNSVDYKLLNGRVIKQADLFTVIMMSIQIINENICGQNLTSP